MANSELAASSSVTNTDEWAISITNKAVDVRHTPSAHDPRGKLKAFLLIIASFVLFACGVLFLPGKHGQPSMWHDMATHTASSFSFLAGGTFIVFFGCLLCWLLFRQARFVCPSDETFYCDHQGLTISSTPWFNFSNTKWRTQTYPLMEVKEMRFAVLASTRGGIYYGLRFEAHGRKWALPGLEAPQAKKILVGLKALGADVPDDPQLDERIKEALANQFGDTSWMDRSWMEPAPQDEDKTRS